VLALPLLGDCDSQSLTGNKEVVLVHGLSDFPIKSDCPVLIAARKVVEVDLLPLCESRCLSLKWMLYNVDLFVEPLNLVALGHRWEELPSLGEMPLTVFHV
jgi:hypothetical protein